jgi:hypothetical protein
MRSLPAEVQRWCRPRSRTCEVIGFVPGVDAEASALTASGAAPAVGVTFKAAAGGACTVTPAVATADAPVLS